MWSTLLETLATSGACDLLRSPITFSAAADDFTGRRTVPALPARPEAALDPSAHVHLARRVAGAAHHELRQHDEDNLTTAHRQEDRKNIRIDALRLPRSRHSAQL